MGLTDKLVKQVNEHTERDLELAIINAAIAWKYTDPESNFKAVRLEGLGIAVDELMDFRKAKTDATRSG